MINPIIPPLPGLGVGMPYTSGIPVGTVVAFAGKIVKSPSLPLAEQVSDVESQGWMLCDGRELDAGQYPDLFSALGNLYGGQGQKFNIPDYRGYFLRGVDGDSQNDPDVGDRTSPDGGAAKKSGVGSRQDDALQTHQHTYQKTEKIRISTGDNGAALVAKSPDFALTVNPIDNPQNPKISQNETRPKNIYVHYLIKYTYAA